MASSKHFLDMGLQVMKSVSTIQEFQIGPVLFTHVSHGVITISIPHLQILQQKFSCELQEQSRTKCFDLQEMDTMSRSVHFSDTARAKDLASSLLTGSNTIRMAEIIGRAVHCVSVYLAGHVNPYTDTHYLSRKNLHLHSINATCRVLIQPWRTGKPTSLVPCNSRRAASSPFLGITHETEQERLRNSHSLPERVLNVKGCKITPTDHNATPEKHVRSILKKSNSTGTQRQVSFSETHTVKDIPGGPNYGRVEFNDKKALSKQRKGFKHARRAYNNAPKFRVRKRKLAKVQKNDSDNCVYGILKKSSSDVLYYHGEKVVRFSVHSHTRFIPALPTYRKKTFKEALKVHQETTWKMTKKSKRCARKCKVIALNKKLVKERDGSSKFQMQKMEEKMVKRERESKVKFEEEEKKEKSPQKAKPIFLQNIEKAKQKRMIEEQTTEKKCVSSIESAGLTPKMLKKAERESKKDLAVAVVKGRVVDFFCPKGAEKTKSKIDRQIADAVHTYVQIKPIMEELKTEKFMKKVIKEEKERKQKREKKKIMQYEKKLKEVEELEKKLEKMRAKEPGKENSVLNCLGFSQYRKQFNATMKLVELKKDLRYQAQRLDPTII